MEGKRVFPGAEQEKLVRAQPDYAPSLVALGVIDAALGRKKEALREGRRAIEVLPITKESEQINVTAPKRRNFSKEQSDADLVRFDYKPLAQRLLADYRLLAVTMQLEKVSPSGSG